MQSAKYLIVGGGGAGTTAAAAIRQHDADGRIVIIEDESHRLYSRVALPSYLRGKTTRERVFLKSPEFYEEHHIDLMPENRATGLDIREQVVTLASGERWQYGKLLIATGSQPRTWHVPGAGLLGVTPLRTIDHADALLEKLPQVRHVTVVGGGFITLELVQLLHERGIAATVVVRSPYYWGNVLDEESGRILDGLLRSSTATVVYNTEVQQVVGNNQVEGVILSDGRRINTDLVLANIGTQPDLGWLQGSMLRISRGVETNEYLEASAQNIYAAGDIAVFFDPVTGIHHNQGNWTNAVAQGRIAGLNMAGVREALRIVSSYSIMLFSTNITFLGRSSAHSSTLVIPRGSVDDHSYGRILIEGDRVIGATLINRLAEAEPVRRLILSRANIRPVLAELADRTVALKDICNHIIHEPVELPQ